MTGMELFLTTSLAVGGAATIQQGRMAEAQGSAQKKIAEYNAKQAQLAAKSRLESSKLEASRFARKGAFMQAANRAAAAKSGISIKESPTTIDVLADTAYQLHLDTNILSQSGMVDYVNMQSQASLLRAEGAFAKKQGQIAQKWGYVAGGIQLGTAGIAAYGAATKPTTVFGKSVSTGSGSYGGTMGGGPTGGASRSLIG
jgi:hypothetical protein